MPTFGLSERQIVMVRNRPEQNERANRPHLHHLKSASGHIIEVGEPMSVVVSRLLGQGMSVEQAAERTGMPVEAVQQIAASVDR